MAKTKKVSNEVEQEKIKKLTKQQVICLVIVFISCLLIVYVAFLGMSSRPVEEITKEEALNVASDIYGTSWILDDKVEYSPLAIRNRSYKKLMFLSDIDQDELMIPFYLYLDENENIIGRELAFVFYEKETSLLKAELPDGEIYNFVYSKSRDGKIESLVFIKEGNKRTYYINESLVKNLNQ
jgi:hypothetical protein